MAENSHTATLDSHFDRRPNLVALKRPFTTPLPSLDQNNRADTGSRHWTEKRPVIHGGVECNTSVVIVCKLVTTRSSKLRDGLLLFNARAKRQNCSNWRQSGWAVNGKSTFTLISALYDRSGVPEYYPISMVKAVELPIIKQHL